MVQPCKAKLAFATVRAGAPLYGARTFRGFLLPAHSRRNLFNQLEEYGDS